jgi:hypothetical protein
MLNSIVRTAASRFSARPSDPLRSLACNGTGRSAASAAESECVFQVFHLVLQTPWSDLLRRPTKYVSTASSGCLPPKPRVVRCAHFNCVTPRAQSNAQCGDAAANAHAAPPLVSIVTRRHCLHAAPDARKVEPPLSHSQPTLTKWKALRRLCAACPAARPAWRSSCSHPA